MNESVSDCLPETYIAEGLYSLNKWSDEVQGFNLKLKHPRNRDNVGIRSHHLDVYSASRNCLRYGSATWRMLQHYCHSDHPAIYLVSRGGDEFLFIDNSGSWCSRRALLDEDSSTTATLIMSLTGKTGTERREINLETLIHQTYRWGALRT